MLVRLLGVSLELGDDVTIDDLWDQLDQIEGIEFTVAGLERLIYVDEIGDYKVALILTIKDTRRWMEMTRNGKKATIKPEEVAAGRSMVDFNFVALHKASLRGLYLHYRGSVSVPKLSSILWNQHRIVVETKRAEWLEDAGKTAKNLKRVQKLFTGNAVLSQIVRQEDMPELLKGLEEIESLTLDYEGIQDASSDFNPLNRFVKATRYKLRFEPKVKGRTVADKIMTLWDRKQDQVTGGRVTGRTGDEDHIYDFEDQPATTFGQFNFDSVAEPFDSDDFTSAPLLLRMIKVMNKEKSMFHAEVEE